MIEGAYIALFAPAIDKIAVGPPNPGQILIEREHRRRLVVFGKLQFHRAIILQSGCRAINCSAREPSPPQPPQGLAR